MSRPRAEIAETGLVARELRARLGCSVSEVRRMQAAGILPRTKDADGNYRFQEHDVAAAARHLTRAALADRTERVRAHFAGVPLTRAELKRIVAATAEAEKFVLAVWAKNRDA